MNFLTNLNLNTNQLLNGVVHNVGTDPATGTAGQIIFNTTSSTFKYYDGSNWVETGAGSIQSFNFQTDDSNTTTVNDSDTITVTGASAGIATSISGDTVSITLADITNAELQNDSIDITNSDGHLVIGNSGTVALGGTIAIETQNLVDTVENQTIGGDKTFSGATIFNGDVTINGTTTTVDSTNLLVEDPLIVVAKNQTGASPSLDAGLIVERGDEDSMGMFWDESADEWVFVNAGTENGSTSGNVGISSYVAVRAGNATFEQVTVSGLTQNNAATSMIVENAGVLQKADLATVLESNSVVDITSTDTTPVSVSVTDSGSGVRNIDVAVTLATDGDARTGTTADSVLTPSSLRATEDVQTLTGDGTSTSFTITHNMGTKNVLVQVFEVTTGETVYPEITRGNDSSVTIGMTPAPADQKEYTVLIKSIA